jgi:hypothetical protein
VLAGVLLLAPSVPATASAQPAPIAPTPWPPVATTRAVTPSAIALATPTTPQPTRPAYLLVEQASLPPVEAILASAGSEPPENMDPAQVRVLVATGDIIPARRVNARLVATGDFRYPFYDTLPVLQDGDLRLADLEAPLIDNCPIITDGFPFCGDPRFLDGLVYAGIDVVNVANNHMADFGPKGAAETYRRLAAAGIDISGNGEILYRDVKSARFALVGYNGVGPYFDRALIAAQIGAARQNADIVVAQFHWGAEYTAAPRAAPGIASDDPRAIARLAIDSGADLVIGNHPHWVQGIEVYQDRLIAYAHGNFIFDQGWSRPTSEGVIGRYVFYGNRLVAVRYIPVVNYDEAQPRLVEGDEAGAILERMRAASATLAGR